MKENVDRGTHA